MSRTSGSNYTLRTQVEGVFTTSPFAITGVKITDEARQLYERDPVAFLNRCGDRYVYAIQYGAVVSASYVISAFSQEEYSSLLVQLTATFRSPTSSGSFEAGAREAVRTALQRNSSNMRLAVSGGYPSSGSGERCQRFARGRPRPDEVNEVMQLALNADCLARVENPVIFTLRSYDELLPGGGSYRDSDESAFVRLLTRAYARRASLRLAMMHPTQFGPIDPIELRRQIESLDRVVDTCRATYVERTRARLSQNSGGGATQSLSWCLSQMDGESRISDPLPPAILAKPGLCNHDIVRLPGFPNTHQTAIEFRGNYTISRGNPGWLCPLDRRCGGGEGTTGRLSRLPSAGGQETRIDFGIDNAHRERRIIPPGDVVVWQGWETQPGCRDNEWLNGDNGLLIYVPVAPLRAQ
ncbi:hypothetical protein [Falsiroseomonas oryzae]|uniref:hypothetical protein n=1 Tax=Falsiroseomonas oryzae TaxID=2766473 RepID=UPI0022EA39C1|nr:hypothetical protein [Roseomonas sp. MO-31]